jgi:thiol-disulfide isomerase/thioredoxin
MFDATYLRTKHEAGQSWSDYLAGGKPQQREDWQRVYDAAELSEAQRSLVTSFGRQMKVIVLSGIWCGDCAQQVPLIQRIAEANPAAIDLRYLDRDAHMDLQQQVSINAGHRVPVVVFCAEDYELVGWYGDRTLSRYRAMAARQLGGACPLPGAPVPRDERDACLADWLAEFERAHLLLRLSARLRQKHGD